MKKTASSKDRLAKSGKLPKRTSSGGSAPQPGNPATGLPSFDLPEGSELNFILWPEWSEQEVLGEKWATKHVFEDPEGFILLPRSLRALTECHKRPTEYLPDNQNPVMVLPVLQQDDSFQVLVQQSSSGFPSHSPASAFRAGSAGTNGRVSASGEGVPAATNALEGGDEETSSLANGGVKDAGGGSDSNENPTGSIRSDDGFRVLASASSRGGVNSLQESEDVHDPAEPSSAVAANGVVAVPGMSKFFYANRHLFSSELMRQLVSLYTFLYEQSKISKANGRTDEFSPWDHIYPKGKDGMPMYNTSGKYIVRLYFLGSWRKITVDDRVPLDAEGQPLIISSPSKHELWPLLLTKALLKVAAVSYKDIEGASEHGDFDAFHTLEGWLPEAIGIQTFPNQKLWSLLSKLNVRCQRAPSASISGPSGTLPAVGSAAPSGGGNYRAIANAAAQAAVKDKERSASTTTTSSNNAPGPNERVSTASSTKTGGNPAKQNTCPSVLLFVSRDSEDGNERDVSSLSYPCRIIDVKDIGHSASVGNAAESGSRKYVKIKGYFTTVSTRKRNVIESRLCRTDEGTHASSADASEANLEYWISFSEFCKLFRSIRIYHSQSNFRPPKFISYFPDSTKAGEQISRQSAPSQVIYVTDCTRETNVMISFSTVGRIMTEAAAQHPVSSVKLERYDWKQIYPQRSVLRIASNGTAAALCSFPTQDSSSVGDASVERGKPPHACRVNIDAHNAYVVGFWSKEEFVLEDESKYLHERLGCHVRELEESYPAQPAGSWSILFKQIFAFPDPIYFTTQLFLPETIQHYACLRMYDNDTGNEIPQTFHQLGPRLYAPNKKGYTLVAECKTPQSRPAGKWRARFISEPYPAIPPEKPLELNMKGPVQDFEDVYAPNKNNLLFRYVAKVKDAPENNVALHLAFSVPNIRLRLQVFDNDLEIVNVAGKGIVTLPVLVLYREDFPPVGTASATKDTVAAVPISKPQNRYIIQAIVEQVEFSRSVPPPGILVGTSVVLPAGEPPAAVAAARPTSSRMKNLSGSAKKKKPALSGGPEGAVTGTNNEPLWKLRVLSSDGAGLTLTRDTEKEDRHKALKETWEAAQPGRAEKAKESRETYLKHVEQVGAAVPYSPAASNMGGLSVSGATVPSTPLVEISSQRGSLGTPHRFSEPPHANSDSVSKKTDGSAGFPRKKTAFPTSLLPLVLSSDVARNRPLTFQQPAPHVLTTEEIEQRKVLRLEKMNAHASAYERKCQRRTLEKEERNMLRAHQIEAVEVHRTVLESCHRLDGSRRDEYRKRLLRELEELNWKAKAAAEEASRLALGLSPGIEVTISGGFTVMAAGGNNATGVSEEVPEKKKKAAKR